MPKIYYVFWIFFSFQTFSKIMPNFWWTDLHWQNSFKIFPLSMLIIAQKSCFSGPNTSEIPQPNWYYYLQFFQWSLWVNVLIKGYECKVFCPLGIYLVEIVTDEPFDIGSSLWKKTSNLLYIMVSIFKCSSANWSVQMWMTLKIIKHILESRLQRG